MTAAVATKPKPKRVRDTKCGSEEYFKFMTRMLRMYRRRTENQEIDVVSLEQLAGLQRELDEQTLAVVLELRNQGVCWDQIGSYYGLTKAGAYKKWITRTGAVDPAGARKPGGQPGHLR